MTRFQVPSQVPAGGTVGKPAGFGPEVQVFLVLREPEGAGQPPGRSPYPQVIPAGFQKICLSGISSTKTQRMHIDILLE